MPSAASFFRDEAGNVGVWFGLMTIPITVAAGIARDYGQATSARATLQATADRAALEAAAARVATEQERTARASAFFPPPEPAPPGAAPPSSPTASVSVAAQTVTVNASQRVRTGMLGIMGVNEIPVSARAVAQRIRQGPPICMMALNPTASGAIAFSGSADFVAEGCALYSNSSSGSAIQGSGSATARAGGFCAVGGVSDGGGRLTPTPEGGCDRLEDPFRNLPAAGSPSPTYNNVTVQPNTTEALSPGTYRNGLTIKGTATLSPGLYVIEGSLSVSSQANVSGSGITFYLTGNQAGFDLNGGGTVDLSAATSGPYSGMLIVQDRTANDGNDNKLNGGSGTRLQGGIYIPTQTLTFTGSSGFGQASTFMPIIADQIKITGNATVRSDVTAMPTPAPLPTSMGGARLTN